jgi:hypothetical protein
VYDWALIATQFIAEYMDLEINPSAGAKNKNFLRDPDINDPGRLVSNK